MDDPSTDVEIWLSQWSSDQQEMVKWLAGLVHAAVEEVDMAIKWRQLTFTVEGNWHHWLCAISVTARGVNLTFHKGSLLDDPAGVLEGAGRYCGTCLTTGLLEILRPLRLSCARRSCTRPTWAKKGERHDRAASIRALPW